MPLFRDALKCTAYLNGIFFPGVAARIFYFIQRAAGDSAIDVARPYSTAFTLVNIGRFEAVGEPGPALYFQKQYDEGILCEGFNFVDIKNFAVTGNFFAVGKAIVELSCDQIMTKT